jgi:hypothetical protein
VIFFFVGCGQKEEFRTCNDHHFARKENGRDGERVLGIVSDSNGPPCKLADRNFAAIHEIIFKKKRSLQDFWVFSPFVVVGFFFSERQRKRNSKRLRLAKDNSIKRKSLLASRAVEHLVHRV